MPAAIEAERLGKRYPLGEGGHRYVTLRETLGARLRRRAAVRRDEIWALRDVDLEVEEGDVVGIVGRNGAGKTTFLKTVAHIVQPTTGLVRVRGRVGALLEVGTGFHPELTGRENVFLNGVVLGMSRREIARRFDDIVEFAGVERFLDTPIKRYSSGMYLRLAFSVAAHIEPDVVVVDEVLAVGDAEFQKRSLGRMSELSREGRTVLFVSHDTGTVGRLCRRAVWLEHGTVRADGPAQEVLDRYLRSTVLSQARVDVAVRPDSPIQDLSLAVTDADGVPVDAPRRDEQLVFELGFTTQERMVSLDAAIFVLNRNGVRVINENVSDTGKRLGGPPQAYRIRFAVPPVLAAGDYVVGVWIGNEDQRFVRDELLRLTVLPLPDDHQDSVHGLVRPDVRWSVRTEPGGGADGDG
jgi:ABC-2 type transport system ATP-binding protein/lipopolysaccharide transport system ATP-binding protein